MPFYTHRDALRPISTVIISLVLVVSWCSVPLAQEFPTRLSMNHALEIAVQNHPTLRASAAGVKAFAGSLKQAGLLPNPLFTFQSENWRWGGNPPFEAGQDVDIYAYFSQPIELFDKRKYRLETSRLDLDRAKLENEAAVWHLRQQVKKAFLQALLAQSEAAINRQLQEHFQQVIDYHRHKLAEGMLAEADLLKVQLEAERLSFAHEESERQAEDARLALLRVMGMKSPQPFVIEDFPLQLPDQSGMDEVALLQKALQHRHEAQLARCQVERAHAQVNLTRSQGYPDLTAILGYKRTVGQDTIMAGFSIPLPLFDRNQGSVARSLAEITKADALQEGTTQSIQSEVNSALASLRRRYAMLNRIKGSMLDKAEESWRIAHAAYKEQGVDILRFIDAFRTRNEIRLMYERTVREYQLSVVELEAAVGQEDLAIGLGLLTNVKPFQRSTGKNRRSVGDPDEN